MKLYDETDCLPHVKPALLPCPFCGEAPTVRPLSEPFTGVAISCETPNCPASPISTGNALADPLVSFSAWNRRVPVADAVLREAGE